MASQPPRFSSRVAFPIPTPGGHVSKPFKPKQPRVLQGRAAMDGWAGIQKDWGSPSHPTDPTPFFLARLLCSRSFSEVQEMKKKGRTGQDGNQRCQRSECYTATATMLSTVYTIRKADYIHPGGVTVLRWVWPHSWWVAAGLQGGSGTVAAPRPCKDPWDSTCSTCRKRPPPRGPRGSPGPPQQWPSPDVSLPTRKTLQSFEKTGEAKKLTSSHRHTTLRAAEHSNAAEFSGFSAHLASSFLRGWASTASFSSLADESPS